MLLCCIHRGNAEESHCSLVLVQGLSPECLGSRGRHNYYNEVLGKVAAPAPAPGGPQDARVELAELGEEDEGQGRVREARLLPHAQHRSRQQRWSCHFLRDSSSVVLCWLADGLPAAQHALRELPASTEAYGAICR